MTIYIDINDDIYITINIICITICINIYNHIFNHIYITIRNTSSDVRQKILKSNAARSLLF